MVGHEVEASMGQDSMMHYLMGESEEKPNPDAVAEGHLVVNQVVVAAKNIGHDSAMDLGMS